MWFAPSVNVSVLALNVSPASPSSSPDVPAYTTRVAVIAVYSESTGYVAVPIDHGSALDEYHATALDTISSVAMLLPVVLSSAHTSKAWRLPTAWSLVSSQSMTWRSMSPMTSGFPID